MKGLEIELLNQRALLDTQANPSDLLQATLLMASGFFMLLTIGAVIAGSSAVGGFLVWLVAIAFAGGFFLLRSSAGKAKRELEDLDARLRALSQQVGSKESEVMQILKRLSE